MLLIYYSHSYRKPDDEINEFFQDLMLAEGMTPSLDPPSDRLNAAKPERHLRSTDGMIAVLPYRDPAPSDYILYEIALCARAHKPALVFVEDVLPNNIVSGALLQRRFSRRHFLRDVRNYRYALRMFKSYIGEDPPPTYQPRADQRSCLVIGASAVLDKQRGRIEDMLKKLRYNPIVVLPGGDCLSYDHPYEEVAAQSMLCLSFTENLSPREFYLLGAARAFLMPTILLTQDPNYSFTPQVPKEYQPRQVSTANVDTLCDTIEQEINIFEEDYLEIKDQDKVRRYRTALLNEGKREGVYSSDVRDSVLNIVMGNVGAIDMSKDKIQISNVVGPVNIKSRLDHVTQVVNSSKSLSDDKQVQLTQLIAELQEALKTIADKRPDDTDRIVRTAETVAAEVAKEKSDKGFLNITLEGLKQAAKAVEDVAPAVISVATKIASFVMSLF